MAFDLLDLPLEVLQCLFMHCDTTTLIRLISTCREIFNLAAISRNVILHHLFTLPGPSYWIQAVKSREEGKPIPFAQTTTAKLFLTLRQRASECLCGAELTANRRDLIVDPALELQIDLKTADLGHSPGELDLFFAFRDRPDVQFYSWNFQHRQPILDPYADGDARVVLVARRQMTLSILYAWTPPPKNGSQEISPEFEDSSTPKLNPFKFQHERTTRYLLSPENWDRKSENDSVVDGNGLAEDLTLKNHPQIQYHVFHYSLYDRDRVAFQTVPKEDDLVPVHMSVKSGRSLAILWDNPQRRLTPSNDARIMVYKPSHVKLDHQQMVTANVGFNWSEWPNWSSEEYDRRNTTTAMERDQNKPRAISFAVEDRYLKLYAAGGLVPYSLFSCGRGPVEATLDSNHQLVDKRRYMIEQPFRGEHTTLDDGSELCCRKYLSLAVLRHDNLSVQVKGGVSLWIVRYEIYQGRLNCAHKIDLDYLPWEGDGKFEVVARLAGWTDGSVQTTLTGLDTVKISRKGDRIAVAQWDKVFVWAVRPGCLFHFDKKADIVGTKLDLSVAGKDDRLFEVPADAVEDSGSGIEDDSEDAGSEQGDGSVTANDGDDNGGDQEDIPTGPNHGGNSASTNPIEQLLNNLNNDHTNNDDEGNETAVDSESPSTTAIPDPVDPKKPDQLIWSCYDGQTVKDLFDEGSYVELEPIVLDLDGAVARRMIFTTRRCVEEDCDSADDADNDVDSHVHQSFVEAEHIIPEVVTTQDTPAQDEDWETTDTEDETVGESVQVGILQQTGGEAIGLQNKDEQSNEDSSPRPVIPGSWIESPSDLISSNTSTDSAAIILNSPSVQAEYTVNPSDLPWLESNNAAQTDAHSFASLFPARDSSALMSTSTSFTIPELPTTNEEPTITTISTIEHENQTTSHNPRPTSTRSDRTSPPPAPTQTLPPTTTDPDPQTDSNPNTTSSQNDAISNSTQTSSPLSPPIPSNPAPLFSSSTSRPSDPTTEPPTKSTAPKRQKSKSKSKSKSTPNLPEAQTSSSSNGAQDKDRLRKGHPRTSEDELIILTDRGVQVWHLGPRATRRREREVLDLSRL